MKNFLRKGKTGEGTTPVTSGFGHRTPEQIQEALKSAQAARARRAVILREIKSGQLTLAQILDNNPPHAEDVSKMRVMQVLRALPGVGAVTAQHAMDEIGIIPNRKVGGLGFRQANELLQRFG